MVLSVFESGSGIWNVVLEPCVVTVWFSNPVLVNVWFSNPVVVNVWFS